MSAWSKVKVHELGFKSSSTEDGQEGRFLKFLLSLTNTLADAQTSLARDAKFVLGTQVGLTEAHLERTRWDGGRSAGRREGEGLLQGT